MWERPRQDPRDLAFLRTKGIEARLVETSFFKHAPTWACPVCGTAKHDLIHRRRNGRWFSGIEEHHYGSVLPAAGATRYMTENATVFICYLCNTLEKDVRKATRSTLMSVEMMRTSVDFMERRATMVVRDTYGTPDPKGIWNTDGTRRR